MTMISTEIFLMIFFIFSLIDWSDNLKPENDNDVFFEITEPTDINYTFRGRLARNFGSDFNRFLKDVYLIPAQPLKGCSQFKNHRQIKENLVLVERGECSFISKALFAEQVGALGIIIIDNDEVAIDQYIDMIDDLTQRTVELPALFVKYRDGHLILNSIERNHVIGARINIPLNLTYDDVFKLPSPPGHQWP